MGETPLAKRQRTAEDSAGGDEEKADGAFRFSVGQQVLCNISKRSSGFLWKVGTITQVAYRPTEDECKNPNNKGACGVDDPVIPYVVKLDNGSTVATPEDDDECVRLAARCCDDTRVMRQLAVSEEKRQCLRFSEGYRVSVQLDVGIWEEGIIIETWAIPERNGKPLKTWVGFAVPYAVSLDLGDTVLVPFDTDEVIRPEKAVLPPQKSLAEQIGGTERKTDRNRFVVCQNTAGHWVRKDNRTGVERPCSPPSPASP